MREKRSADAAGPGVPVGVPAAVPDGVGCGLKVRTGDGPGLTLPDEYAPQAASPRSATRKSAAVSMRSLPRSTRNVLPFAGTPRRLHMVRLVVGLLRRRAVARR